MSGSASVVQAPVHLCHQGARLDRLGMPSTTVLFFYGKQDSLLPKCLSCANSLLAGGSTTWQLIWSAPVRTHAYSHTTAPTHPLHSPDSKHHCDQPVVHLSHGQPKLTSPIVVRNLLCPLVPALEVLLLGLLHWS